jgi:hypothetical protein
LSDKQSLPPSLSAIRSEFQILCDNHGGPAPVCEGIERSTFEWACREFYFAQTWTAYQRWAQDETNARRYWPWVALVAAQYKFERTEKESYDDEPKPSEITALVNSIAIDAQNLRNNLASLQNLSCRLGDAEFPWRRLHLAWIHEYISQSLTAGPRGEIDDEPSVGLAAHFAMLQFCKRLVWVEVAAAHVAANRIDPELLKRLRMQADRGISRMVAHAAMIWKSLTGRPASVNKVTRAGSDDGRPDFAIFVSNIAELACNHQPTLAEIVTAFRTPNSAENKSS